MRTIAAVPFASLMLVLSLTCPCVLSQPSVAFAAPANVPQESAGSFSELKTQAEEHRAAGRHAEAARVFMAAYDVLTEREQGGVKGEIAVGNAVDDFNAAQKAAPEDLSLFEDEATLLERFTAHPMRKEAMPPGVIEELERVNAKIAELRHKQEEAIATEAAAKAEAQRKAQEAAEAEAKQGVTEASEARDEDLETHRRVDAVILGVGLVSVLGGTALVADGAWNLGNVRRRGDELLAALDANSGGDPGMRDALRQDIESWRSQWRGIGTGLVVSGAVVAAAGIGLTTWGAIRMRKRQQGSEAVSALWPLVSVHGVGASVVGRF